MATRYPPEWKEAVRARADIVSIVSEYVPLKQKGHDYWACCPFHGEKTPSFKVSPERGTYYCFGCKATGDVFRFIMDMERMEFGEAARFLAEKVNLPVPELTQVDEAQLAKSRSMKQRILELNQHAARFYYETLYTPGGKAILEYLHGRGLDDGVIRKFGLGAAPAGWDVLTRRLLDEGATIEEVTSAGLTVQRDENRFDMFRGRAIFPIINAHGHVLGFGGRAMGDAQPKYLNTSDTPAFNKRENVYAANLLRKTRGLARVLLVEGYMDVVSLLRHGVEGVAATLGTSMTPEQAKLMKRYAPQIWIAYDGDRAGQNATLKALDILDGLEIPSKVLVIPGGQDPDEYIRQHGREAFDSLVPQSAPRYRMERAKEGLDLATEDGRTQYAIRCAGILRAVKQPVEVENLLKRLMVDTGYSREVLIQQIGITKAATPRAAPQPRKPAPSRRDAQGEDTAPQLSLLHLLASGFAPEGVIRAEHFDDDDLRWVAERMLAGQDAATLLDACEDEALRQTIGRLYADPVPVEPHQVMDYVTDCVQRISMTRMKRHTNALQEQIKALQGQAKRDAMAEYIDLLKEQERLRPGRKE